MGDGMTEKGQGGGNLVETFELHKITSLPTFCAPLSSKEHIPLTWNIGGGKQQTRVDMVQLYIP